MKIIKSARVFNILLPPISDMTTHLEELPFSPIGNTSVRSAGFLPNASTAEIVTPIPGGYSFSVRVDEKILPASSVNLAVNDAIVEKEQKLERDLSKEEAGEVREAVVDDLITKALVKTMVVHSFYDVDSNFLIVATTNKQLADTVVRLLIRCVGSVKATAIYIDNLKNGLTTKLMEHLYGSEKAFGELCVDDYFLLRHKTSKATFDQVSETDAEGGLQEALSGGMQVEAIGFVHETMAFRLCHDFSLKRIRFFGDLSESEQDWRDELDGPELWRVEAGAQLLELTAALTELSNLFEYEAPEDPLNNDVSNNLDKNA